MKIITVLDEAEETVEKTDWDWLRQKQETFIFPKYCTIQTWTTKRTPEGIFEGFIKQGYAHLHLLDLLSRFEKNIY